MSGAAGLIKSLREKRGHDPSRFLILKPIVFLIFSFSLSSCSLVAEVEQLLSQQSQEISLNGRPIANQSNQEELLISGRCMAGVGSFQILSPPPVQTVGCIDNGSWSTTVDVSGATDGIVQIITDHKAKDGQSNVTFQIEKKVSPPSVNQFIINDGNLFSKESTINYLIAGNGVQSVYVTEDSNCTVGGVWKPSQGTVSLSSSEGEKALFFKAKDSAGNTTACLNFANTVTLDQTPPQVTGISDDLVASSSKTWSWSCSDANGPCKYSYIISKDSQSAPALSFSSVTSATQSSGSGIYYLSVLAQDVAGNISLVKKVQAILASDAPLLALENGALYKNSSDVTLQLSNLGDFDKLEISNSTACATPSSLNVLANLSWQLDAGEGLKTIYYRFKNTSTGETTSCEQKSITIDKTAPTVALSTAATSPISGTFHVKATFSEVVTGFTLSDIQVTNGTASLLIGTGAVYEFDITPAGSGVVSIKIPGLSAFDLSGNGNSESSSLELTMVASKIAATLSSSTSVKTNVSPIPYTVVFAESVTGFSSAGISVEGGTLGSITGSGASYSFDVTPSGEGVIKVQILEDSAQTAGGSSNLASALISRTFDETPPVITGLSDDPNWKKTANWSWGCNKVCTYRKITSTNPTDEPTGAFGVGASNSTSGNYAVLYLHVQAKDEAGNLSPVYHYSVHLDSSSPMNPQTPTLGAVPQDLTTSPTMSWTEPTDNLSGVSRYDVEIYLSSNNSVVKSWTTVARGSALTGLNLQAGLKYYFKVRAVDKAGNISSASGKSADWTALAASCPAGFILVPKLAGYTTADFCVAKYEMKDPTSTGVYISQASGLPVGGKNRAQAIASCQSMGAKYSLIKNNQWQTIARNIESVESNWSFSGKLNQGFSELGPSALEAFTDDSNPCYLTADTCTASVWKTQKRTHTLSNGSVIWDLGGNLGEWVFESLNDLGAGPVLEDGGMPFRDFPNLTPEHGALFGPADSSLSFTLGLGFVSAGDGQAIVRGGSYGDSFLNGVFASALTQEPTFTSPYIGFRCVYEP